MLEKSDQVSQILFHKVFFGQSTIFHFIYEPTLAKFK